MNREIRTLQTRLEALPDEISKATRGVRQERDQMLYDEKRKASRLQEKAQEDYDRMKDDLNGKMTRLRAECDERVRELEKQVMHFVYSRAAAAAIPIRFDPNSKYAHKRTRRTHIFFVAGKSSRQSHVVHVPNEGGRGERVQRTNGAAEGHVQDRDRATHVQVGDRTVHCKST